MTIARMATYKEAQQICMDRHVKTRDEYRKIRSSYNLPYNPEQVYSEFKNWECFLTGRIFMKHRTVTGVGRKFQTYLGQTVMWTFEECRAFARTLGLKSYKEWQKYWRMRKNSKLLKHIPMAPNQFFTKQGCWTNYPDFLGCTTKPRCRTGFMPYDNAKKLVRKLGIKTCTEFQAFAKSNVRPFDFPSNPSEVYGRRGLWKGYSKFLGNKT